MMRKILFGLMLLVGSVGSMAQVWAPPIVQTTTTPTACSTAFFYALTTTSPWTIYGPTAAGGCQVVGAGGGGSFTALSGDAVSTSTGGATTVKGVNNTILSALGTGVYWNTTSTGVPSIATGSQLISVIPQATSTTFGTVELGLPGAVNITSLLTWTGCTPTGTPATQCIVGTAGTTITATGIPGTYSAFAVIGALNNSTASAGGVNIQFDGDVTIDYASQQIFSTGTSVSSAGTGFTTSGSFAGIAGTASGANPTSFTMTCPNYAGTTFNKTCYSSSQRWASTGQNYIQNYALSWIKTTAITSLVIFDSVPDNFVVGSTVSVYGMP
jgi:hypothetical protein